MLKSLSDVEILDGSQVIGVGAFSKVHKCRSVHDGKIYALKAIDNFDIPRVQDEIRIQKSQNHPRIARLYDSLQVGDMIYLLLEFAPQNALYGYIHSDNPFPEELALRFVFQTSQAIKHLHAQNIIHRDIKPENILLDEFLNVKLADFGWACQLTNDNEKRRSVCGTFEYMSPEIVLAPNHGKGVDVWNLGILLIELIQGQAPFKAHSIKEVREHFEENGSLVPLPTKASKEVLDLLKNMLEPQAKKRYTIEQVLAHPVFRNGEKRFYSPLTEAQFNLMMKNFSKKVEEWAEMEASKSKEEPLSRETMSGRVENKETPRTYLQETESNSYSQSLETNHIDLRNIPEASFRKKSAKFPKNNLANETQPRVLEKLNTDVPKTSSNTFSSDFARIRMKIENNIAENKVREDQKPEISISFNRSLDSNPPLTQPKPLDSRNQQGQFSSSNVAPSIRKLSENSFFETRKVSPNEQSSYFSEFNQNQPYKAIPISKTASSYTNQWMSAPINSVLQNESDIRAKDLIPEIPAIKFTNKGNPSNDSSYFGEYSRGNLADRPASSSHNPTDFNQIRRINLNDRVNNSSHNPSSYQEAPQSSYSNRPYFSSNNPNITNGSQQLTNINQTEPISTSKVNITRINFIDRANFSTSNNSNSQKNNFVEKANSSSFSNQQLLPLADFDKKTQLPLTKVDPLKEKFPVSQALPLPAQNISESRIIYSRSPITKKIKLSQEYTQQLLINNDEASQSSQISPPYQKPNIKPSTDNIPSTPRTRITLSQEINSANKETRYSERNYLPSQNSYKPQSKIADYFTKEINVLPSSSANPVLDSSPLSSSRSNYQNGSSNGFGNSNGSSSNFDSSRNEKKISDLNKIDSKNQQSEVSQYQNQPLVFDRLRQAQESLSKTSEFVSSRLKNRPTPNGTSFNFSAFSEAEKSKNVSRTPDNSYNFFPQKETKLITRDLSLTSFNKKIKISLADAKTEVLE